MLDGETPGPRLDIEGARDSGAAGAQLGIAQLADQFYRKRKGRGLTLGQASQQIGVSAATLSRFERQRLGGPADGGAFVPDTRTLTAISTWLGTSVGSIVGGAERGSSPVTSPEESTPDKIEMHLRADRNLSNEAATTLAQLFRLAYNQVARTQPPQEGGRSHGEHEGT